MKISPKKSLGQHFLINPRILDKIVAAAEITEEDIVLEVGPGTGNLTRKLADKTQKIIAVEKDRRLINKLKEEFRNTSVEIAEGDILKLDIWALFRNSKLLVEGSRAKPGIAVELRNSRYKVVGNIPYYITSRFIRTIFEKWPKPKLVVLTIQKEVAQRIVAKPPKMNLLALSVQFFAKPQIVGYISKENFRPRPKVDSAIIRLTPINGDKKSTRIDAEKFFKIVKAGFSQKRKLLIGNLSGKLKLRKDTLLEIFKKLKITPKARAENLALEDWINLTNELKLEQ